MWRGYALLAMTVALFSTNSARAAVIVTPATPTAADSVTIRLQNSFGSEARATSATITQSGNAFTIEQNVELACLLPSSPIVASEFQVGPLAPGSYSVTANITFTSVDPIPCIRAPITQTGSFSVAPSAAIPTLRTLGLVLLGFVLAGTALLMLRA
jgi:hypothetical protein